MSQITGISSIAGLSSWFNQGIALDSTPNSVNWSNAEETYPNSAETINQTFSGIDTTIKVYVKIINNSDGATIEYSKNNGSWTDVEYSAPQYNAVQISISNNDTLKFRATSPTSFGTYTLVDIMQNISGGDVVLDSIAFTVLGDGGGGPS
jgi:hypothetical protein